MTNYIKTSEKIQVENYPWGYTLKTTLFDSMEFNPKKGYRHVTQTIDPKTGRLCNPKKSTYGALVVRYYDEIGHIKCEWFDFNGDEAINKGCKFIAENFDLFTHEEIKYLYATIQMMAKVDFRATVTYCGSNIEDLKPFYIDFLKMCAEGYKSGENLFTRLQLDSKGIEATKPANFSPFKVSNQYIIDGNGIKEVSL